MLSEDVFVGNVTESQECEAFKKGIETENRAGIGDDPSACHQQLLHANTSASLGASVNAQLDTLDNQDVPSCIHHSEITGLIESMASGDPESEILSTTLSKYLDVYLEQPILLDPFLPTWLPRLVYVLRSVLTAGPACNWVLAKAVSRAVYGFCKVRGVGAVSVHFDHTVSDLIPVLKYTLLTLTTDLGTDGWMVRYVAMLMSAMNLLIPFDLKHFKGRLEAAGCPQLIDSLQIQVFEKLLCSGRERQAAVLFIYTAIRRSDQDLLADFFARTRRILEKDPVESIGHLECLCKVFSQSDLFSANSYSQEVQNIVHLLALHSDCKSSAFQKCRVKIFSRLAFAVGVEACIKIQLESLSDKDTVVRWSAAKGLARLAKTLTAHSASQITSQLCRVLESSAKTAFPQPATLHGIGLALGEMLRLAILPKDSVCVLTPHIIYMLNFEVPRGRFAVGSAVRDAACYVVWAMARSYSTVDRAVEIASALVCVSLFDREVTCRRAASAALQELVGRWDGIPHGIEILGLVDFFHVSQRVQTYGELGVEIVTKFPVYREALVQHLMSRSLTSWDRGIRELAAPMIGKISTGDVSLLVRKLQRRANDHDDLSSQHGAILGLSKLLHLVDGPSLLLEIAELSCMLNTLSPKMLGWELLADAFCQLISSLAASAEVVVTGKLLDCWLLSIQAALRSRDDNLHFLVTSTVLPAIVARSSSGSTLMSEFYRGIVLPAADKDRNINAQRGFALAIGNMPRWLFIDRFVPLNRLMVKMIRTTTPVNMIEKRCNVIRAVGMIYKGLAYKEIPEKDVYYEMIETLIWASEDYSVDSRGDVGSLVRQAAMEVLPKVLQSSSHRGSEYHEKFTGILLCHTLDKMDRLRSHSINLLAELGYLPQVDWDAIKAACFNPSSFFALMDRVILESRPSSLPYIISGLISSAGCTSRLMADPALELLLRCTKREVFTMDSVFLLMAQAICNARLRRPILQLADRLLEGGFICKLTEDLLGAILEIADNAKANVHDVLLAVSILNRLKSVDERAMCWVREKGTQHEYPRIRELCGASRES